jgi:hypothetical protein
MKTFHKRSPVLFAGGLALALAATCAFAATPPADPDPKSRTPIEDSTMPTSTAPNLSNNTTSDTTTAASTSQTISMQSKFDSLDVNHDGYIDKQEAAADQKLAKQFDKLDTNKDNKLSMTEFTNAKGLAMNKKPSESGSKNPSKDKDPYKDQ